MAKQDIKTLESCPFTSDLGAISSFFLPAVLMAVFCPPSYRVN